MLSLLVYVAVSAVLVLLFLQFILVSADVAAVYGAVSVVSIVS